MDQEMKEADLKRLSRKNLPNKRHSKQEVMEMVQFAENLKVEVLQKMQERENVHENSMEEQIH
jgi:hypothetical protein